MKSHDLLSIVKYELEQFIAMRDQIRPISGQEVHELLGKSIVRCMATAVTMAQDEIREEVRRMHVTARGLASNPEMKGYADACEEVLKEIDGQKLALLDEKGHSLLRR